MQVSPIAVIDKIHYIHPMLQYTYVTHHLLFKNQPEVPRMAADGMAVNLPGGGGADASEPEARAR